MVRFVYHERWPPSIALRFESDLWLISLDDVVTATRNVFGNELPQSNTGGVLYWFRRLLATKMVASSFEVCHQACFPSVIKVVWFFLIQGLVSQVELLACGQWFGCIASGKLQLA